MHDTVGKTLFWSYSNLAMAHSAVSSQCDKYSVVHYKIRAKLYKGLVEGRMNIGTLFDDEKVKLKSGSVCCYCGSEEKLSIDHIFPRAIGGSDSGDNLVYSCQSCNSSKGKKDMLKWMEDKGKFAPLSILRRYLKLSISYSIENEIMMFEKEKFDDLKAPFNIDLIPIKYPSPNKLIWSF